ncbi:5'-methylthioadenosine/adenosylhomocysteine nucleosidase [Chitinasiproducens palmae]|uniref:adenosylhomocysteine nucleosidase n=1 Tax=Chitinasiproducens palmae TaxID=1770053 RepID=A0A1H2PRV0_9BURK|nr:5'-methylthioadenosine/adenosylhomocysteine nucleosidase [Chitinasiproducens palmae]SDV49655.1 adenosylhomocysteine nucleosidase [Chitinasiproducens palmae]
MPNTSDAVAIIAALPQEISALLGRLRAAEHARAHLRGGREYLVIERGSRRLVVTLARVGKVAAATTATALIHQFDVGAIVFAGVAGGLAASVGVGDVVVADALRQHDMDASPLFPRFEVPLLGRADFATDVGLSDALADAAQRFLADQATTGADVVPNGRDGRRGGQLHRGLVLSGDRFVADDAARRALLAGSPGALAVEMEGAAVAQVCHEYGVRCAVMRTISDSADASAAEGFTHFLAERASVVSSAILARFLSTTYGLVTPPDEIG